MQIDAAIRDHSKHTLIFQVWQLCWGFQTEPIPSHPAAQPQPTGLHKFDMNNAAIKGKGMAVTWS